MSPQVSMSSHLRASEAKSGGGVAVWAVATLALWAFASCGGGDRLDGIDPGPADGGASSDSHGGSRPQSSVRFVPARHFYDPEGIHTVRLTLGAGDWTTLLNNAKDASLPRPWLAVTTEIDGESWPGVKLRNFGDGSQQANPAKPNLRLKFNLTNPMANGPAKLHNIRLKAAGEDPSFLHEPLAYRTLRALGAKAPRFSWAQVEVNGVRLGLYQIIEQVDSRFFRFHFNVQKGEKSGANYDVIKSCGGFNCPSGGCAKLIDFYEQESAEGGFTHVRAIAEAAADKQRSGAAFAKLLEAHADVNALLAVYAFELFAADPDGLLRAGQNLELYVDPKADRLHVIRSGADTAFYLTPPFDDPWQSNNLCKNRVDAVFQRILDTPSLRTRFEAKLRALRCQHLALKPTAAWLASYIPRLKAADAHGGASKLETQDITGFVDEFILWLQRRHFAASKRYGACDAD